MTDLSVPKSLDDLKAIPPVWYGVAFGAAAAGAAVFGGHKILAGTLLAAAVIVFAHNLTKPCCSSCASAGDSKPAPNEGIPMPTTTPAHIFASSTETIWAGGCAS